METTREQCTEKVHFLRNIWEILETWLPEEIMQYIYEYVAWHLQTHIVKLTYMGQIETLLTEKLISV